LALLSGVLTLSLAVFVVAGSFVTGSGMAWAQQQGQGGRRPGGFGGGPGGPGGGLDVFGLIGSEQVQKEIELIDAQKGDVQKLSDERREAMRGMFGNIRELPEAERQQKMAEMREKMEANRTEYTKKLADLLLPHQFERLQQISIQVRGASALSDPEVAGKLNLSDAQKSQLTELQEANRGEMQKLFEGARGDEAARQGMREKIELFRTQANEKAMAILTSEQRAQFEAMKGEKFELDMSQFQRGGPGGRPQRRPETGTDNN
jgi:hypothetical protein